MTDTPTKQEIQSKNDTVPGAIPGEQKKNNFHYKFLTFLYL